MSVRRVKVATQPYADSESKTHNLITLKKLKALVLNFVGTLTVAGGTTDGTLVQDGLIRTVLNTLKLILNGKRPIEVDGVMPYWYRALLSGSEGTLVNPSVTVGANACRFNVIIDMDQLRTAARALGRVDINAQDSAFLEVRHGIADGGIVTGGDRTETLTGTLEIIGVYDDMNFAGGHRVMTTQRYPIVAASKDARIIIPSGQLIAGILLYAADNGARNNDIVTNVKAQIGEDNILRDLSWEALQDENVEAYGLTRVAGAPPYTGVAYINFDEDGDMDPAKVLNTLGLVSDAARLTLEVGTPTGQSYVDAMFVGISQADRP
jgi:hypothetical protein